MSSVSFSHQFYKHWLHTPQPVQAALVQELTDIRDFLQTDASLDTFEFSVDDLDAHLDDLYLNEPHDSQTPFVSQPAPTKKDPQTQEVPLLTADKSHTSPSHDNEVKVSNEVKTHDEKANNQPNSTPNASAKTIKQNAVNDNGKDITVSTALKNSALSAPHEALVNELAMHIDDYLSEQMAQISEDLKSWLRAEISQKLSEQSKQAHTEDKH